MARCVSRRRTSKHLDGNIMPGGGSNASQEVLKMMNAKSPHCVIKNVSLWRWFSSRINKKVKYVNRIRIYRKANRKESTSCGAIHSF